LPLERKACEEKRDFGPNSGKKFPENDSGRDPRAKDMITEAAEAFRVPG
jgi:hypothetical protein